MRLAASLLVVGSLLSVSAPLLASPVRDTRVPLVAVSSSDDEDDGGGPPDGCIWTLVCYAPPSSENSVEWINDNKWMYIMFRALAVVGLGMTPVVSLTMPGLWVPFLFHVLIPEEVRPPMSGDLLMGLLLYSVGTMGLAIVTLPVLILPAGFLGYVAINYTVSLWIAPATLLQLYNTAMKENGDEQDSGSKKSRKKAKKKKHHRVDDEE